MIHDSSGEHFQSNFTSKNIGWFLFYEKPKIQTRSKVKIIGTGEIFFEWEAEEEMEE